MREVDFRTAEALYEQGATLRPFIEEPIGGGEWDEVGVEIARDLEGCTDSMIDSAMAQITEGTERIDLERWEVVVSPEEAVS